MGNYHSSRLVPLLLVSVAAMLTPMITPHLSHDWERAGASGSPGGSKLFLKLAGLAICLGSAVVLLAAPLLFSLALQGKFAGGLAVLPLDPDLLHLVRYLVAGAKTTSGAPRRPAWEASPSSWDWC